MDGGDSAWVATTFDLGTVQCDPVLVARGAMGFIWKVTTDRGEYAVKRLQPWAAGSRAPFDVEVQLAAIDAGIRLPRPVVPPDGVAIVDWARVYEWVELDPPPDMPCAVVTAAEVGEILGRIHTLGVPPPREDTNTWYTEPPTHERWIDLVRRGREAGAPWTDEIAAEIAYLDELCARVATPSRGPVVTCHRDFAPGNVLPSSDDRGLVVLDWENAGPLPADTELAMSLVFWCTAREQFDLDACDVLLRAYESAAGCAPPITRASFHPAVVTHVNFLGTNLDNSLDPEQAGEFTDDWIEQLAPSNLRRRMIAIDALADTFATT